MLTIGRISQCLDVSVHGTRPVNVPAVLMVDVTVLLSLIPVSVSNVTVYFDVQMVSLDYNNIYIVT